MQAQSQQIITQMNNNNSQAVQTMVNNGALANISANGAVSANLQQMTNDNKTVLQNSAGASQLYTQMLVSMNGIMTDTNLSQDQKTTALNNQVQELNDALGVMGTITNTPGVSSTLSFTDGPGVITPDQSTNGPGAVGNAVSPTDGYDPNNYTPVPENA